MPSRSDTLVTKDLALWVGNNAASATAGAATLNTNSGVITTEALTTAAAAEYTLTLTNAKAKTTDMFLVTVGAGTSTAGTPAIGGASCTTNGTVVITVTNLHAANAFNGTLKIFFQRVATA